MDPHIIFYYFGIFIVFASHIFMAFKVPAMRAHAVANLCAVVAIAYYFTHKEGYIMF